MNDNLTFLKEKLSSYKSFSDIKFTQIDSHLCLEIPIENIVDICNILKNDFNFDLLKDIVGVDRFREKERFECIYNLWSLKNKIRIFLRVRLTTIDPTIHSLSSVWSSANWMEREIYDLFGINFIKHPDLRRIYMRDDYEYFPLRKDYPLMGLPGSVTLPRK